MKLYFSESDHRYFFEEEPDTILTSVSTLIGKYHEKFDEEKHSKRIAEKEGVGQEEIKQRWRDLGQQAAIKGSLYHARKEAEILTKPNVFRHPEVNGLKQSLNITELKPGLYPELIVYHPAYNIVGTADLVEIFNDGTFFLSDHKGFPLDTEIPTDRGFKLMRDIQVGDIIFDGKGKLTKVNAVSEIHHNQCYQIKFDTNETIVCDAEHKWEIKDFNYKIKNIIFSTEQIFNHYTKNKIKLKIQTSEITLPESSLPIDPYVLGCWLGDGHKSCGVITNMNPELWKEIERRGYTLGKDISNGGSGKAQNRTVYGLHGELRKLKLLQNKHVPDIYMRASHSQRLDLLRGFMDTDGYFNKIRKRCMMSTTKEWQVNAISNLVFSLGSKATIMKTIKSGFGKKNIPAFDVWFTIEESPFLSKNKDYDTVMRGVRFYKSKHRYIKEIEKVETVPTKCIAVESEAHTYLVTRNYIPTHNTNKELRFEGFPVWNPKTYKKEPKKMFAPLNHLFDCNGVHYQIQLSCYAYCLEEAGYECKGLQINHVLFDEEEQDIMVVEYPINYLKKEVRNLFEHYKNKK